jgi:hypothetical protein
MKPYAVLMLGLALSVSAQAGAEDEPDIFSKAVIPLWQERTFKGHTDYTFIHEDDALVLKAHCSSTASAFYRWAEVDLTKTPILHWSWKVDNIHAGLDDISKKGDDFAARVYVVYKGKMPWSVNALNYVWANVKEVGSFWPNAFTKRAVMIAQKSGAPTKKDIWIDEFRDVRQDFKRYFDMDINRIDGVAVMTDCDNSGGEATSYYRNIHFAPTQ